MNKSLSFFSTIQTRVRIYAELSKVRLSSFVILSSAIGYLFGSIGLEINWLKFILFVIGGTLVTFASNAINQYLEKETDKLMHRTMNRPLPQARISQLEVLLFFGITACAGILILTLSANTMTGVLSAVSILLYGFVYTPLKRISSIAVFVGAIPGALPPLIGYVAFTNQLDQMAIWMFLIQFFWQFVHFWAIAWLSYDDYLRAGIMLLPSTSGKTRQSAWITLMYSFALIPLSFYPYFIYQKLSFGVLLIVFASIAFSYQAFRLYRYLSDKEARRLMFASFVYLLVFLGSLFFIIG